MGEAMLALREMVQSLFKAVRGGIVGVVFGHGRTLINNDKQHTEFSRNRNHRKQEIEKEKVNQCR